jgi:hypothetical protein
MSKRRNKRKRAPKVNKSAVKKIVASTTTAKVKQVVKPKLDAKQLVSSKDRAEYYRDMYDLFSVQSDTRKEDRMVAYVLKWVKKYVPQAEVSTDEKGNLYFKRGDAMTYPCVVAHLDTVHFIIPDEDYQVVRDKDVFYAINRKNYHRTGIGGDDKCGIWIALWSLRRNNDIKVALFVEEESGCQGSYQANIDWFKDVSFVLEADRRGIDDFVHNISGVSLYGEKFSEAIKPTLEKYGREEVNGGLTDVKALVGIGLEVCCANASCGYYEPHRDTEYIKADELLLTFFMFQEIIKGVYNDGDRWVYKRKTTTTKYRYQKRDWGQYYWDDYRSTKKAAKPTTQSEFDFNEYKTGYWSQNKEGGWVWKTFDEARKEEPEVDLPNDLKSCESCNQEMAYDYHGNGWWCYGCDKYFAND